MDSLARALSDRSAQEVADSYMPLRSIEAKPERRVVPRRLGLLRPRPRRRLRRFIRA